MDLERLTPAPWHVQQLTVHPAVRTRDEPEVNVGDVKYDGDPMNFLHKICECSCTRGKFEIELANAEFIALARNAFDVMRRRGWNPVKGDCSPRTKGKGWCVPQLTPGIIMECHWWPDPFTALVEADKWYKENVESGN